MKTFWTESVVNRSSDRAGFANPTEYLNDKAKEFERDSGVKWSVSHQHGGYQFSAIDDGVPVANMVSDDDFDDIKRAYKSAKEELTGYVTYLEISELTGIELRRLISIVRWLEKQGLARRTVNRMGKGFAFKLM